MIWGYHYFWKHPYQQHKFAVMVCFLQVDLTFSLVFLPFPIFTGAFRLGSFATDSLSQLSASWATVLLSVPNRFNCDEGDEFSQHPSIETTKKYKKNGCGHFQLQGGGCFATPVGGLFFFSNSSCLLEGYQLVHICATMIGPACVVLNHVR